MDNRIQYPESAGYDKVLRQQQTIDSIGQCESRDIPDNLDKSIQNRNKGQAYKVLHMQQTIDFTARHESIRKTDILDKIVQNRIAVLDIFASLGAFRSGRRRLISRLRRTRGWSKLALALLRDIAGLIKKGA